MKFNNRLIVTATITITLSATIVLSSCHKEKPTTETPENTPATYHLKGTLDGETIVAQTNATYFTDITNPNVAGTNGDNNGDGHPDNGQHDEDDDKTVLVTGCQWNTTDNAGNITTTGTVQFRKEVIRIYITPFLHSQYYSMAEVGAYQFAYADNNKNGAYLSLVDKSGILWTSKGDQPGSSFEILSRGGNTKPFTTITGKTSCILYNSSGTAKPFTGTFSAIIGL